MGSKLLFVVATSYEAVTISKIKGIVNQQGFYRFGDFTIDVLVAGIGSASTAWSMKQWFDTNQKPNLVINIGIAGSFNPCYKIGDVVMPVADCFADFGIENSDNEFLSVFEAGLLGKNEFPYRKGNIQADISSFSNLDKVVPFVKAVTVNMASGSDSTIEKIRNKFNPDVETMEGATFFYICAMEKIPFLAVRAISNWVEPRDKTKWNIPLALNNLANKLEEILLVLK
jgi:futalosine hydrolase